MRDPYLPQILGLLAAGMTSTALAVSGYLHQPETVRFLGTQLTYQAAYRKIPLSLMGTGLCVSAWVLTQTRRDYRRQYQEWERQTLLNQGQLQAIAHQAELEGYQQVAQLEEMANWADRLPGDIGSKFFKSAMSDSRKVLMPPLFVAHDRTLSALGDAKGIARLRDAALLELELIPTIHPTTRKPVSSGKGKLKLPGHAEWLPMELPQIERKITDFTLWPSHKVKLSSHPRPHRYKHHRLIFALR